MTVEQPALFHKPLTLAIQENAVRNPDSIFYTFSYSQGSSASVTHKEFFLAAVRAAKYIQGQESFTKLTRGSVVAIFTLSDTLRYQATIIGLMLAGYVPFPISPTITATSISAILKTSQCKTVLSSDEPLQPVVQELLSTHDDPLLVIDLPPLNYLHPHLEGRNDPNKEDDVSTMQPLTGAHDTLLYLHSSGTTGTPKAIPWKNNYINSWLKSSTLEEMADVTQGSTFGGFGIPSFHGIGFQILVFLPVYYHIPVAIFPPSAIMPTPNSIMDHIRMSKVASYLAFPILVTVWSHNNQDLETLKSMERVFTGGLPLSDEVGNKMIELGVDLKTVYGCSELGIVTCSPIGLKDWKWMRICDGVNAEWVKEADGAFELQVLQSTSHVVAVTNMDDNEGYATADIFEPHPEIKDVWRILGRKVDLINHSRGKVTVPGPIEGTVSSSPLVANAVVFGKERDIPGILIEPANTIDLANRSVASKFVDSIWSVVEKANECSPQHSKISKEMIVVVPTIPRTDKGSIQKNTVFQVYGSQMEKAFADFQG